jgi:hypothetical protein
MGGETFSSSSSRPLGVAWRYGIGLPASRRACRIGLVRAAGAMYDDEGTSIGMVSLDDLHWCLSSKSCWSLSEVGCWPRGTYHLQLLCGKHR